MTRDELVVLWSKRDHESVRAIDYPGHRFTSLALEELPLAVAPASVLVVSGHSLPPRYLHRESRELAAVVARFRPELLIVDSCYGFSMPLLEALARVGLRCRVVGASCKLPAAGLVYGPGLIAGGLAPRERAARVRASSGTRLESMTLDVDRLRAVQAEADSWQREKLRANLQRVHPNLVRVRVPGGESTVLVPVPPSRFRSRARWSGPITGRSSRAPRAPSDPHEEPGLCARRLGHRGSGPGLEDARPHGRVA